MKLIAALFCVAFLTGCPKKTPPANIEAHCTMNGYGSGKCTFTNKGDGSGAHCVKVRVFKVENPGGKSLTSSTICSGTVGAKESKSKDLSIPGVNSFCSEYGKAWTKVCAFTVSEDK
jgi:hypothetical protein